MPDYLSSGLWAEDGCSMSVTEVPLSDALKARLEEWCAKYDRERDVMGGGFDSVAYSAEGLEIAKALKLELPDCVVVYFDEAQMEAGASRDRYEFEVK